MKRPEDDKEFMEVVGHLISHPRFQKLDGIVQHHHSTRLEHSVNEIGRASCRERV